MKLSFIHKRKLPQNTRVFTSEEHQGAAHKKQWYQKYERKSTPYRWPAVIGPKPLGYDEHILR